MVHNEELHSLYRFPNIVTSLEDGDGQVGHVARMEESRNPFKILTGTPTGKRPIGIDGRTILEIGIK